MHVSWGAAFHFRQLLRTASVEGSSCFAINVALTRHGQRAGGGCAAGGARADNAGAFGAANIPAAFQLDTCLFLSPGTASEAAVVALLAARAQTMKGRPLEDMPKLVVYTSDQVRTSVNAEPLHLALLLY